MGCWPQLLSKVISIPCIALHSIHTALQLKPPQSPLTVPVLQTYFISG